MAEFIERDKFRNILEAKAEMTLGTPKQVFYNTIAMLDLIPAADVVEVVRCKDCEYRTEKGICEKFRQRYPFYPEDDFHCGYGKRKGGADNGTDKKD